MVGTKPLPTRVNRSANPKCPNCQKRLWKIAWGEHAGDLHCPKERKGCIAPEDIHYAVGFAIKGLQWSTSQLPGICRKLKGGDPSAGSPTDTLLQLSPPRET